MKTPELAIVDGAPGLEKALAALWSDIPVQRRTVHKHRNLLAHAPDRLHDEFSAGYKDMIYAGTKQEIETKRKAFIRKWRLKCPAAAASLEEAGGKLFTFTRFPKSQWKSIRTSNAIERLHEEFKRRIKTQTVLPPELVEGGGNRGDVVLGPAGFWPDHDAQGGRLAKPRREAFRSNH